MQKFAIAIGLLLSLLFLTGSNVNVEIAMLRHQICFKNATRTVENVAARQNLPMFTTRKPAENV